MQLRILEDKLSASVAAAEQAAGSLRAALKGGATARLVAATGTSQLDFLDALTQAPDIDWTRVELFHLDEYVGLPITHPASFRKYLLERLINKTGNTLHHLLNGEGDPLAAAKEVGKNLVSKLVDLTFVGIGENGHLAFNDPPADFEADAPYLVVQLDESCRWQQVNEGWFASLENVPATAISMSIRQILRSKEIIAVVPEARKAKAVKACLEGDISPLAPASILRTHANATIYLDRASASLLSRAVAAQAAGDPPR